MSSLSPHRIKREISHHLKQTTAAFQAGQFQERKVRQQEWI